MGAMRNPRYYCFYRYNKGRLYFNLLLKLQYGKHLEKCHQKKYRRLLKVEKEKNM